MLSFLRRFRLWRPAPREVIHTLVCGASRSGKSEAELARLVPLARQGDCAIVVMDPPGTLAAKYLLHLHALGLTGRVIYDRLADTDRVPGYDWLSPSGHPDPLQREAENDERVREFASILLRRRGIHDPATTPVIEEALLAALRLHLAQDPPAPLVWLAEVFDKRSPRRARMIANCIEPELVRKFHEYGSLNPNARRVEAAPAERILRNVLTSPAFRVRSGKPTFDLGGFLDEKGILVLDGSSAGSLSRDAASVMMGAVTLHVIRHCRTGSTSRVVLVLDEAINAGLVGPYESQALAEAAKWGLQFVMLVQDPFGFPTEQIRSNVLQNTGRHEWFRQGSPEAARVAAEDIGTPQLDPMKIHHVEYRTRTKSVGFERVRTSSVSTWHGASGHWRCGRTWNTALWPVQREVRDAQERYTGLSDQIMLFQRELMRLRSGFRFVRCDRVTPSPEYVQRLRDPNVRSDGQPQLANRFGFEASAAARFHNILRSMKDRPEYRRPASQTTDPPSGRTQPGAAQTLSCGPG